MHSIIRILLLAATACMLAACSEEEQHTAQAEPPAAEAPADEPNRADEGLRNLREGAQQLMEGGRQLSEEAVERANRAVKDAEPALRRTGEAINQLVDRAVSDFETAIDTLERRIDEADTESEKVPGDPTAVLAPADKLNADTRAAARAVSAGVGPNYVGVWAADPASCSKIDQETVEIFAVITPTTIRRYENVCNFDTAPLNGGAATVSASCIAEGATEEREITFTLPSPGTLQIGRADDRVLADFVRCRLPEQR